MVRPRPPEPAAIPPAAYAANRARPASAPRAPTPRNARAPAPRGRAPGPPAGRPPVARPRPCRPAADEREIAAEDVDRGGVLGRRPAGRRREVERARRSAEVAVE